MKIKKEKGSSMVEVVVASAIIASSFVAILGVYVGLSKLAAKSLPRMQAAMLAEEGIEALKSMRDVSFGTNIAALSNSQNYYLNWGASSSYSATTSVSAIDNVFYRTFTVANAYRDGSFNLASSGTNDPDTRLVTVNVAWNSNGATSTYQIQTYISNIFDN